MQRGKMRQECVPITLMWGQMFHASGGGWQYRDGLMIE